MRLYVPELTQHYGRPQDNLERLKDALMSADQPALIVTPPLYLTGASIGPLFARKEIHDFVTKALHELSETSRDANAALLVTFPEAHFSQMRQAVALIAKGQIARLESNYSGAPDSSLLTVSPAGWWTDPLGYFRAVVGGPAPEPEYYRNASSLNIFLSDAPSFVDSPELLLADFRRWRAMEGKKAAKGYHDIGVVLCPAKGDGTSDYAWLGDRHLIRDDHVLPRAESVELPQDLSEDLDWLFEKGDAKGLLKALNVYAPAHFPDRVISVAQRRPLDAPQRERFFQIPAAGLQKRLEILGHPNVLLGLSGGMDSTLALLLAKRALEAAGQSLGKLKLYYIVGFGSTEHSRTLARELAAGLGLELTEIDMRATVASHFEDIGQDPDTFDVTYENAQARERTQILMDLANKDGGIVLGTGTLSEAALGWATYNGDQTSMYHVNASIPKSLVPDLLNEEAGRLAKDFPELAASLKKVADSPASPELVPNQKTGVDAALAAQSEQLTEELLGPYELFDYFLWHFWGEGKTPREVYDNMLAVKVFPELSAAEIREYFKRFLNRYFRQQFKRRAMPDFPRLYPVDMASACGMPGDFDPALFTEQL